MKKNGFTLVEILAVLVLVAAIAIISIPSIINYVNGRKNEISKATQELIFTSADLYVDNNKRLFPEIIGNEYCSTLKELVDSNLLEAPIIDSVSGKEINLDKFIKVRYLYDEQLQIKKYNYQIVDNCQPKYPFKNGEILYFDVTKGKTCNNYHEDNSKTGYNGTVSTKTTDNQNGCLKFYVFNNSEKSLRLNLLLDHNTTATVNWSSSPDNSNGPDVLLEKLKSDTDSWVGTEIPTNYTDTIIDKNISYEGYKARLITKEEIHVITDGPKYFFTSDGEPTETCYAGNNSGCLYKLLYDRINNIDVRGYWTASAYDPNFNVKGIEFAYLVAFETFNSNGVNETVYLGESLKTQNYGLRPVIEVSKIKFIN